MIVVIHNSKKQSRVFTVESEIIEEAYLIAQDLAGLEGELEHSEDTQLGELGEWTFEAIDLEGLGNHELYF